MQNTKKLAWPIVIQEFLGLDFGASQGEFYAWSFSSNGQTFSHMAMVAHLGLICRVFKRLLNNCLYFLSYNWGFMCMCYVWYICACVVCATNYHSSTFYEDMGACRSCKQSWKPLVPNYFVWQLQVFYQLAFTVNELREGIYQLQNKALILHKNFGAHAKQHLNHTSTNQMNFKATRQMCTCKTSTIF